MRGPARLAGAWPGRGPWPGLASSWAAGRGGWARSPAAGCRRRGPTPAPAGAGRAGRGGGMGSWRELLDRFAAQQEVGGALLQAAGDAAQVAQGVAQLADGRAEIAQPLHAAVQGLLVVAEQRLQAPGHGLQAAHGLAGALQGAAPLAVDQGLGAGAEPGQRLEQFAGLLAQAVGDLHYGTELAAAGGQVVAQLLQVGQDLLDPVGVLLGEQPVGVVEELVEAADQGFTIGE